MTSEDYALARSLAQSALRRARGRAPGRSSELAAVKREIRGLISDALAGKTERGAHVVAGRLYDVLLRALKAKRRARKREELEERIAGLVQRVPELEAPVSPEPRETPQAAAAEEPEGKDAPTPSAATQQATEPRSWWRRWFGFE